MEEFGREMYKLYKMFVSKAKQIARDKDKQGGGALAAGVKRDSSEPSEEEQFAPVKLSSLVQESVKQFKVHTVIKGPAIASFTEVDRT